MLIYKSNIKKGKTNSDNELIELLISKYRLTDIQAAYEGDPAAFNTDEIVDSYPGFYAIMVNRLAHELYLLDVPMIPRIMTEYAHSRTGLDIHPGATIGRYFFLRWNGGRSRGNSCSFGTSKKTAGFHLSLGQQDGWSKETIYNGGSGSVSKRRSLFFSSNAASEGRFTEV